MIRTLSGAYRGSAAPLKQRTTVASAISARLPTCIEAQREQFSSSSRVAAAANGEEYFGKVLIANRGEIACRVMKTCKRLGIKTVAIYSEADSEAVHVRMADEAVCVGPAASAQSYLKIPNIMEAVRSTGAEAVHPGYGFLSENSAFCQALHSENVTFIGPEQYAIKAMGDKIESKRIATEAGVSIIPGNPDLIEDEETVVRVSREIGYPVMIKASAGGGGKGMRIAYNDEEAKIGFRLSREEAASSFGDDRIFVEKFIEDPRHIEIQLLADSHGNVVAFPERECSIQRRNQKVIEEAPSVLLDDETRRAMGEQAAMLARAVDYRSAGTVEMLCDKHKNFYFLEMNTRLQVEHPVTELITGVDLVEQMIRIAAGYELPKELTQGPLPIKGWAMESRVYAEDPIRGFLPSTGRLLTYEEPTHLTGVRVDSGITEGSDISMFYDPMISKLITYGKDRQETIDRMEKALDEYVIRGPGHNISFLRDVTRHPRFKSGAISTKFIAEEYPEGFSGVKLEKDEVTELLALSAVMNRKREIAPRSVPISNLSPVSPVPPASLVEDDKQTESSRAVTKTKTFWAMYGGGFGTPYKIQIDEDFTADGAIRVKVTSPDGSERELDVSNIKWKRDFHILRANIDGRYVTLQLLERLAEGDRLQFHGAVNDVVIRTETEHQLAKHMLPKPEVDTSKLLQCPMPGMLVSVAVEEGQEVEIGQELCVVEAMKMQNVLRAEKKGKVAKVNAVPGASLKVDEVIVEFA